MSNVLEEMKTRRSIRKFKPDAIPQEILDQIIEAGTYAHDLGIGSCWIHRAKEEFESSWGRELLASLGIEDEYEGIGHCALGYVDGDYPDVIPRKENRVFYLK